MSWLIFVIGFVTGVAVGGGAMALLAMSSQAAQDEEKESRLHRYEQEYKKYKDMVDQALSTPVLRRTEP
jgi:uncharacterized membrane-anchored protein YhcB (DUF1043 family)